MITFSTGRDVSRYDILLVDLYIITEATSIAQSTPGFQTAISSSRDKGEGSTLGLLTAGTLTSINIISHLSKEEDIGAVLTLGCVRWKTKDGAALWCALEAHYNQTGQQLFVKHSVAAF